MTGAESIQMVALFGGAFSGVLAVAWRLSSRLTRIEDKINNLPCRECVYLKGGANG